MLLVVLPEIIFYMPSENKKHKYAERILADLFKEPKAELKELFEQRLNTLNLSVTSALSLLGIEHRALTGILEGTQKRVDISVLSRLALFLGLSKEEVIKLLLEKLEINFEHDLSDYKIREFILLNFDLTSLLKYGFISSTTDFSLIETELKSYFGFKSIFEYGKDYINAAFSSGKPKPKNTLTKDFWIQSAAHKLKKINNPYNFDRSKLLAYIPYIRLHSTNVRGGLYQVIRELFKLGVTVIFEPYINSIYVRGATFAINSQPCIVLTNYTKYYPSIWFALIHELHHVLYDWDDILINNYMVSGEFDINAIKEIEADDFAREFLFSAEKMRKVKPHIDNQAFVHESAKAYNIHASFIYIFYCWEQESPDIWAKYIKFIPDAKEAIEAITIDDIQALTHKPKHKKTPVSQSAQFIEEKVFNSL